MPGPVFVAAVVDFASWVLWHFVQQFAPCQFLLIFVVVVVVVVIVVVCVVFVVSVGFGLSSYLFGKITQRSQ